MARFLDVARFTPTAGGTTDWTVSAAVQGYQTPAAAGAIDGQIYRYRAESADLSQWEIGYGAASSSGTVFARTTVLFNSSGTTSKISFTAAPTVGIVPLGEDFREKLDANRTYYVATTGSDTLNNGLTVGSPFLTIQKAWNLICGTLDLAGFSATIQIADGTYSAGISSSLSPLGGNVTITGNLTTIANVLISVSGGAFNFSGTNVMVTIQGMKITSSGGSGLVSSAKGVNIRFQSIDFGSCTGSFQLWATNGGSINGIGAYTISGSASAHMRGDGSASSINLNAFTVTITGTPAYTIFAYFFNLAGAQIFNTVWSGSATGKRYQAVANAVIYVFGQETTYLPGNSAGSTSTGGQYT